MLRTFTKTAVIAGLLALTGHAHARVPTSDAEPNGERSQTDEHAPRVRLHFEPVVVVPLGDLAGATGPGVGAMLGVDYALSPVGSLTFRGGYVSGSDTTSTAPGLALRSSVSEASFLVGAKYYLVGSDPVRLYAQAEAGVFVLSSSGHLMTAAGGAEQVMTSSYFGVAASAGVELDWIDLRAALLTMDVGHAGGTSGFMGSVAFRFAAF